VAAERANRTIGLELNYRYDNNPSNLMRRSDHWPFINMGYRAFVSSQDYTRTTTRPTTGRRGSITSKVEKAARLAHQMSWDLAQQDARPKLLPRKR